MPDAAPAASIVVPAFGVGPLLAETLRSIRAQSRTDWEAIVVDDGDTEAVARVFAVFADDPRMRLLQTDNRGVSAARNRGIAAARGAVVTFLDGDDLYAPDYLHRMLAALDADPALAFVGCDARLFGEGEDGGRRYSDLNPMAGPVTLEAVLTRRVNVFTAAAVRRKALARVGGFDEDLTVAEDFDLWVRLLVAGWTGAIIDAPLASYRRRRGSLSTGARRLLADSGRACRKAAALLRDRPEAAVARQMAERYEERARWLDGEALILQGRPAEGLALLARADDRSPRWRLALAFMRWAPWLAGPMLRVRAWLPRPAGA